MNKPLKWIVGIVGGLVGLLLIVIVVLGLLPIPADVPPKPLPGHTGAPDGLPTTAPVESDRILTVNAGELIQDAIDQAKPGDVVEVMPGTYHEALTVSIHNLTLRGMADASGQWPILDGESIETDKIFRASRYDKGGADYINCPMSRPEYDRFYEALLSAEKVVPKSFEKIPYFEGCVPIEVMAERGRETLVFGPMKPVGLVDPRTGKRPYAVVQLRQEDAFGSCYNMVGFQTKMTWPEQRRVFRMIPGLAQAEFLRYGSLHRNTFINAPFVIKETLQIRRKPNVLLAGQLVGVEGYVESAAMGLIAGINGARLVKGLEPVSPPDTTAHGSLLAYLTRSSPRHFQPMNINFGLFPPIPETIRDKQIRRKAIGHRAIEDLTRWSRLNDLL